MTEILHKIIEKPLFNKNEDKRVGICQIKTEYIIEDHCSKQSAESNRIKTTINKNCQCEQKQQPHECVDSVQDVNPPAKKAKLEEKKEKLRGQNKARPPPFKTSKKDSFCPWLVDKTVNESEKLCVVKMCSFMHDRAEYLKIKPQDIGEQCWLFELSGKCPRGVTCRIGSRHLTADGYNIIDKEKFEAFQKEPNTVKNQISKDLQERLRKFKYNFSKAERIAKLNSNCKNKTKSGCEKQDNGEANVSKKIVEESNVLKSQSMDNIGTLPTFVSESINCGKEKMAEGIKNVNEANNSIIEKGGRETENCEIKCGAVMDTEEIKLTNLEKKKVVIDWRDKVMLSPLTTVGNLPFRRICKEYGADITCGEMALAPQILKGAQEEWALIKRHKSEDIFGVQICGNNPGVLTRCAQLLNQESDIDFVDINLGCPIDLIYKQGAGCGMLNRLNILESVVKYVNQVLDIPLTVKTRTGIYMDKPIVHNLMPKFREWGVSMINIHGRSREQRYTKLADWKYIETCAQSAQPIPVYGTGDILSFEDYDRVRKLYTSVSGVSIGRGALIKPWIFQEIKQQKLFDISSTDRLDMLKKYVEYGLQHWGSDTRGVETTRRFLLEWMSFLHRYIPVGILEHPPQKMNERPPFYKGRNHLETLMASSNCADWIEISEMLLGKVPDGFHFLPKHKANAWR